MAREPAMAGAASRRPVGVLTTRGCDLDCAANRDGEFVAWAARRLKPLLWRYFRPVVRGLDLIPPGAGLLVGNHNAALLMPDILILGVALHERFGCDGLPFGMTHTTGLQLPLIGPLLARLGGLRGSQENGLRLLAEDRRVWVYPGGELDSMRAYRDRARVVFGARRGYVRLALRSGAPIVPFVAAGAHETLYIVDDGRWLARWLRLDRLLGVRTWPIVLCLPWGLWIGVPPPHVPWPSRIYIEVLEPIRFARQGEAAARDPAYVEECHVRVHGAMQAALRRLCAERAADRAGGRRGPPGREP